MPAGRGFESGAHVYLVAAFRSDRPDEVELRSYREEGSVELDSCILTATMGNYERLRVLHLSDRVLTAQELYGEHDGTGFAAHTVVPVGDIPRTPEATSSLRRRPTRRIPQPRTPTRISRGSGYYPGRKVTQHWRKPAEDVGDDLRAQVNARRVYWASEWPIPGGVPSRTSNWSRSSAPVEPSPGITPQEPAELLALPEE